MGKPELPIIELGGEWDDQADELAEVRGILAFFLDDSWFPVVKLGIVEGERLLACLWGTTRKIAEFHIAVSMDCEDQGVAKRLILEYVSRYDGKVDHIQAAPIDKDIVKLKLAALRIEGRRFIEQDNGVWILEPPPTSSRS